MRCTRRISKSPAIASGLRIKRARLQMLVSPVRVRVSPSTKGLQTSGACTPHRWTSDQPRRSHGAFSGLFSAFGPSNAGAATHVGPGVRERRAIVGSFRGLGPPRWRADPPPPARPPGRATIGWRIGPPAGGARATRRRGPRQARRRCPHPSRARAGARRAAAGGPGLGLVGRGAYPDAVVRRPCRIRPGADHRAQVSV